MKPTRTILTLGSSTRSTQEFLDLLAHYQIEAIADVRRFPTSRFDHFIKESLAPLLQEKGIAYLYLGEELGGYRSGGYEAYRKSVEFEAGLARLQGAAQEKRVAIMCSERLPGGVTVAISEGPSKNGAGRSTISSI